MSSRPADDLYRLDSSIGHTINSLLIAEPQRKTVAPATNTNPIPKDHIMSIFVALLWAATVACPVLMIVDAPRILPGRLS